MKKLQFVIEYRNLGDEALVYIPLHLGEFLAKMPFPSTVRWTVEEEQEHEEEREENEGPEGIKEDQGRKEMAEDSTHSNLEPNVQRRDASIW